VLALTSCGFSALASCGLLLRGRPALTRRRA
jgi:hypothetical protein